MAAVFSAKIRRHLFIIRRNEPWHINIRTALSKKQKNKLRVNIKKNTQQKSHINPSLLQDIRNINETK